MTFHDLLKYEGHSGYAGVSQDTKAAILLAIETIAEGQVIDPNSEANRIWDAPTDTEVELVRTFAWSFVGLTEQSLRWRSRKFPAPRRDVYAFEGHPKGAQFSFGTEQEAAEYAEFLRQTTGQDVGFRKVRPGELGG